MDDQATDDRLYGYAVMRNTDSGKWEVRWGDEVVAKDFKSKADAEDWIEDQIPLNR